MSDPKSMRKRAIAWIMCCLVAGAVPVASGLPASARNVHRAARSYRLGDRVLARGMIGTDVFHLQVLLTRRGFRVASDRVYGAQTVTAVQRAQRAYALVPDGIAGPLTISALRAGRAPSCSGNPGPGTYVTRWLPAVYCVLGLLHVPQTPVYANDVLLVIAHESAGNPLAINNWDINAQRGDPSRGLMQVIGRVFARYRSPALPNDIYNAAANIYAGVAYAIAVYGGVGNIPGVKSVAAGRGYVPYKQAVR